jgi:hypothetical protein
LINRDQDKRIVNASITKGVIRASEAILYGQTAQDASIWDRSIISPVIDSTGGTSLVGSAINTIGDCFRTVGTPGTIDHDDIEKIHTDVALGSSPTV